MYVCVCVNVCACACACVCVLVCLCDFGVCLFVFVCVRVNLICSCKFWKLWRRRPIMRDSFLFCWYSFFGSSLSVFIPCFE